MEAELLVPIAKSPLDSARGRGKKQMLRHTTPKVSRCVIEEMKCGPTTVRIIIQNETLQLVEYHGKEVRTW